MGAYCHNIPIHTTPIAPNALYQRNGIEENTYNVKIATCVMIAPHNTEPLFMFLINKAATKTPKMTP